MLLRCSNKKLTNEAATDYRGLMSDLERATAMYPDASILQATPKHKASTSKAPTLKLTSTEYNFVKSHKTLETMKVNAIQISQRTVLREDVCLLTDDRYEYSSHGEDSFWTCR